MDGINILENKFMDTFCSEDSKELAGAMLKVQSELNPAVKDASNPFARSRYATLNSVITASREALLKNGIWVVQYPVPAELGHLGLVTRLTHASSGQWQSCLMVMPLAKSDPQGFGSAMTYARRYSISALIGLIVEDDDAESACGRTRNGYVVGTSFISNDSNGINGSSYGANGGNGTKGGNGSDHNQEPIVHDNSQDLVSALPALKGINYQAIPSNDGRICVVATGNTLMNKDTLKNSGFRWNPDKQSWWRYAD
jgi:hypothetical protein